MKLVLSPAKSLDFETKLPTTQYSQPLFLKESERINKLLKKKSAKSLSKLMSISEALGQLNYQRNQEWQLPVRILSGLYGVLKPFDLMQPYRLEMRTKFPIGKNKNLYHFWKKKVTQALNEELKEDELFLNLASSEYVKVIDTKALKVPVIHIEFKDLNKGEYKIIGIFAKLARGLMTRYILDTNAKTMDDIKGFNFDGYGFSESMSKENNLVFIR